MNTRQAWRFSDGIWLASLSGLAIIAAWPLWRDIFTIAIRNEEQSHILLTPVVFVWLIWVRRSRFRRCKPERSLLGPVLVLLGWMLAWFGFRNDFDIGRHFGAVLMLVGAWLSVLGPSVFQAFLPAAASLIFLLPVPGRIRAPIALELQRDSALVTEWFLQLFGFPVERAENLLLVNGHEIAVAEACNGMRMVSALGLVTFAFVFSYPMRNSVRLFILVLSPLIALIVNVTRLTPTVLMYGYAKIDVADVFHEASGWVMLFVGIAILYGILWLLRWLQVPISPRYALSGS